MELKIGDKVDGEWGKNGTIIFYNDNVFGVNYGDYSCAEEPDKLKKVNSRKKTIAVIADDEGRFDKWVKEKIKPKETILKYDGYRCETEKALYVWCDLRCSYTGGLQIDDIIDISTRAEILYTRITPIYKGKKVTYTLAGIKFKLDEGELK